MPGKQPKTGTVKANILSKDLQLRTCDTDTNPRWIWNVCCALRCNDHHGRLHSWHSLLAPKAFTLWCRTCLWALQISTVTIALAIKLRLSIRLLLYTQALHKIWSIISADTFRSHHNRLSQLAMCFAMQLADMSGLGILEVQAASMHALCARTRPHGAEHVLILLQEWIFKTHRVHSVCSNCSASIFTFLWCLSDHQAEFTFVLPRLTTTGLHYNCRRKFNDWSSCFLIHFHWLQVLKKCFDTVWYIEERNQQLWNQCNHNFLQLSPAASHNFVLLLELCASAVGGSKLRRQIAHVGAYTPCKLQFKRIDVEMTKYKFQKKRKNPVFSLSCLKLVRENRKPHWPGAAHVAALQYPAHMYQTAHIAHNQ